MTKNDFYPVSLLSNNDTMNTMTINLGHTPIDSYFAHEIENTFNQERLNAMYAIPELENYQELQFT